MWKGVSNYHDQVHTTLRVGDPECCDVIFCRLYTKVTLQPQEVGAFQ